MKGPPVIEVFPGRDPVIRDGDRVFVLTDQASVDRARAAGFDVSLHEPGPPLSRTPIQNHHEDPLVVDPRRIRPLNDSERAEVSRWIRDRAFLYVAGFETWRGADRWLYVDVLGVARTHDDPKQAGIPVGPVDSAENLRMVGDQLALRLIDPWGHGATRRLGP